MGPQTFRLQPVYEVKPAVLQVNGREQDGGVTRLAMKVMTSGTRYHLFSTTRAVGEGAFTHI